MFLQTKENLPTNLFNATFSNLLYILTKTLFNFTKYLKFLILFLMENSTLKAENIKPIILKAGVPLAVSLAGLVYAWIITKKKLSKVSSFSENNSYTIENEIHSHDVDDNFSSIEDEEENDSSIDSNVLSSSLVVYENHSCLEQEVACLRSKIEGMKIRELALAFQFEKYCEMKERESMLMEIKNMLSMEMSRVEFFDREISLLETETIKLENFVVQYFKIIEKVEYLKSENRVLEKKVKKLLKKSKAQSVLIKEQTLMIKEGEAEIMRNYDELQKRANVIDKLEDEIREMKMDLDNLVDEKNEVLKKLEISNGKEELHKKPLKYYLQVESRDIVKEDYNKVLKELEHVKKEHENEVEELIYLRNINVCLRKELMKHELHCSLLDHHHHHQNVSCIGSSSSSHGDPSCSKKGKLIKRLKKWVDGSERVKVKEEGKSSNSAPTTPRFCSSA
ncbi:protein CHUP1, chloroplastic [Vicia villosa]|uniref:protein CHUP1, chloroplastic n=1 Tax=Vicia villosa TaxID=3911 RepID=UPI00273CBCE3|nr:protein CHUP1, chloroplastic [Vicia villosa]